ncbi:MAG: NAD(+) synthase [Clostridiales bacterium]|nr:NAD(+) synthase [Clostridiales bacterium]
MSIVVTLCTPQIKPGAVKSNTQSILACIAKAKKSDVVVFPRLCITGATCSGMFSYPLLTNAAGAALEQIAAACGNKTVIIGLPTVKDGKVFDSIAIIKNGATAIYSPKKGMTDIAASPLCYGEDVIPDLDEDGLKVRVLQDIDEKEAIGADLVIIPTAYPTYVGGLEDVFSRAKTLRSVAIVSAGKGESVSGKIMSGDKIVCTLGKIEEYAGFDEESVTAKLGVPKNKPLPPKSPMREVSLLPQSDDECAQMYELMGRGVLGRMREIGTDKVILGLSGGLDSTNVLVALTMAFDKYKLDKKNIICVTMRGGASSKRTQDNSAALIDGYKVTSYNIPIDAAVTLHMRSIAHEQKDIVYENAQARERTQILLDLSNKFNALMVGTGDLSEICLGFSTFGGDQLSQYNPNCSITKTAMRKMLKYYTTTKHAKPVSKIIEDILSTPISPELLSGQETEEILGPYNIHDFYITEIVAKKLAPKDVMEDAINQFAITPQAAEKYMKTLLNRLFKFQFKRNFGPDGVQMFPYDLSDLIVRSDFSPELWLDNCGL